MSVARRMPAEWEPHAATWIAWPHHEPDWPEKLPAIDWVYAEIVRVLAASERVEILCHDEIVVARAKNCLELSRVIENYRIHIVENDRSWLRDSAPTAVNHNGQLEWISWRFNAWAKYDNFKLDAGVPSAVSKLTDLPMTEPCRPDNGEQMVLEGGAIETDGEGTLLVTEECLLSNIQERNPGLDRTGYEQAFKEYLGIEKTIWLGRGCQGDDTHGHIDDLVRFVAPGKVVAILPTDESHPDYPACSDNIERLKNATDAKGRKLEITILPMPREIYFGDEALPASYVNFYIANSVVLVPTFNDLADRQALQTISELFPNRNIIGIHAVDLVIGQGTLHCLTQQQPE